LSGARLAGDVRGGADTRRLWVGVTLIETARPRCLTNSIGMICTYQTQTN
jgi:hypothetical protein